MNKVELIKIIDQLDISNVKKLDIEYETYDVGHDTEKIHFES